MGKGRAQCLCLFLHPALGKGRAQCLCLFLHPPRLEPCMRLSPHTAQHRLDTSSPVTVPRHPAGAFPRVRMRVPGLLGEPTGCGPSPCAPAFPGSNYYAHTATPSGLGVSPRVSPSLRPARLPSRWELPMCTILDSCDVRSVAVTRSPVRSLRLPNPASGGCTIERLSQAPPLAGLLPAHGTFQGHATHLVERPTTLSPNGS